MGTIVVGYVSKPEGRAALRRAAEEARLRNLKLVVIHSYPGGRESNPDDAVQSEAELEDVKNDLGALGVEHEVRQLVRGREPAEDLISAAEDVKAELIVIGLRRRSPVGKLILGSNAQRILLDASCPVLAVKSTY
ncbi:MAG: universal stress protein [Nocardioidaceae bacterium]